MTVLSMFKIMLFFCNRWLNVVLNSLKKIDNCSAMLVGCRLCVTIREYEVGGCSVAGESGVRGKGGN